MTAGNEMINAFETYTADIYAWAYRLLGRHHDALDVVQDVFLKWSRQCSIAVPDQPRGWLRRVTLNRAIDLTRKQRTDRHVSDAVDELPDADRTAATLEQDELRGEVARALDHLTDSQRNVLIAKIYDEMTFAKIATGMDLGVSTIKTHYVRAIQAVREKLQPRYSHGELLRTVMNLNCC